MSIDLTFDGTTRCRGQRAWFPLVSARVLHTSVQGEPCIDVTLASTRTSASQALAHAEIILEITNPEELRTLICGLSKAYAQMTIKDTV